MNTNEELKTRLEKAMNFLKSFDDPFQVNESGQYIYRSANGIHSINLPYILDDYFTTHVEPLQAENNDLHLKAAEFHSLKMSLLESPLKEFLPKKEMSFHDKIIFAIHDLQHAYEKLKEEIKDREEDSFDDYLRQD